MKNLITYASGFVIMLMLFTAATCEGPIQSSVCKADSLQSVIDKLKSDTTVIYIDLNSNRYPAELSQAINQVAAQEQIIDFLQAKADASDNLNVTYQVRLKQAAAIIKAQNEQLKRCVIDGRIKTDSIK